MAKKISSNKNKNYVTDVPTFSSKNKKKTLSKIAEENTISKVFDEQNKEYKFRNKDLLKYRKQVEEIYNKKDLYERFNEALKSDSVEIRAITPERLFNRAKPYGKFAVNFNFEYDDNLNQYLLTARNRKGDIVERKELKNITTNTLKSIYNREKEKSEQTFKEEKEVLEKKGFDNSYKTLYIPEDTEPKKKGDSRKTYRTTYISYYRFSLLIYRIRKNKKYEIIYQIPATVQSPVTSYISFQEVIAQVKYDILHNTGLTLEEWIYISKINPSIIIEGGVHFKRFKERLNLETRDLEKMLDYEQKIDFDKLSF